QRPRATAGLAGDERLFPLSERDRSGGPHRGLPVHAGAEPRWHPGGASLHRPGHPLLLPGRSAAGQRLARPHARPQTHGAPRGTGRVPRSTLTSLAPWADQQPTTFAWAPGSECSGMAAVLNSSGGMDLRRQAEREFAAFLANLWAGVHGLVTGSGETISLNP